MTKQPGRQLGYPTEGFEFSVQVTEGCGSDLEKKKGQKVKGISSEDKQQGFIEL